MGYWWDDTISTAMSLKSTCNMHDININFCYIITMI